MSDPKPRIQLSCEQGAFAAYADAVTAAGGLPCPGYAPEPDLSCVGLVLCGGGDLDPDMFGWPQAGGDPPDRVRDLAEVNLFRAFYLAGRPILGICRGMQVIAAAQGGGLIQDLPPEQCVFHKGTKRDDARHPVRTMPGSLLERLYGPILHTNSFHHQAVADPGFGMTVTAWSEGGVAEAMEHQRLPILGVQFHPERMSYARRRPDCDDGGAIWDYFLKQCREVAHGEHE